MVSREDAVILLFATVAVLSTLGAGTLTDVADTVLVGIPVLVGVVAPQSLHDYLESTDAK